jgi:hypothetical protein
MDACAAPGGPHAQCCVQALGASEELMQRREQQMYHELQALRDKLADEEYRSHVCPGPGRAALKTSQGSGPVHGSEQGSGRWRVLA